LENSIALDVFPTEAELDAFLFSLEAGFDGIVERGGVVLGRIYDLHFASASDATCWGFSEVGGQIVK
jgi:3D (Asp-Asp-Asp) domain-containing protein